MWWLRAYFRRNMRNMTPEKAGSIRTKLSMAYAFLAWNTSIVVAYIFFKDQFPKATNSEQYAKFIGVDNARIVKFSGFKKVEDFETTYTKEEIDTYRNSMKQKTKDEVDTS